MPRYDQVRRIYFGPYKWRDQQSHQRTSTQGEMTMNSTELPAVAGPIEREVRPQRLYIVRIVREAYVLAVDEDEAKQEQREIERWEDPQTITAEPWAGRHIEGWDDGCGVYGNKVNLSLLAAKKLDSAA
jgi:hypothetical protein